MFQTLIALIFFICQLTFSNLDAVCCCPTCCQSVDISVGWRRESLDWKTKDIESSYIDANADSHILFKDINSYTISGKARWMGSSFYARFGAEYGFTFKGQAKEHFDIHSPLLHFPIDTHTNDAIKRQSEVYDFDGAVGYPFLLCGNRFLFIPTVGFSYHRQRLRVKEDDHCCSCPSDYSYDCPSSSSSSSRRSRSNSSYCGCCSSSSSSSFFVCQRNPFIGNPHDNPFSESSHSDSDRNPLGLFTHHSTSNYRFTWYGFYLGTDLAYALDPCWTLSSELEFHFLNRCHRKRESWTGVEFVDDYHHKGWAYGFNGVVGVTYTLAACWYTTLNVDFKWWHSDHSKDDRLEWKMVGAKIGLGYMF